MGEWLILDGQKYFTFGGLPHHFAFYLAMFIINVFNLSMILKKNWKEFYGIAGIGVLLGILPVIIDALIIDSATQKYFYVDGFYPLLFDRKMVPFGESLSLWVWLLSVSYFIFISTKSWFKTLLGFTLTYISIHMVGYVSNIFKDYILSWTFLKIPDDYFWTMWWLFISFLFACIANWDQFKHTFYRIHHAFVWGILVLLGAKLVGYVDNLTLLRAFIMAFSFFLVMIVNDYFDKDTDRINQRESTIDSEMMLFTIYCHIVLVLTSGELDLVMGVITFLCFILGIAYNFPVVFRLKQNFVLGSLVEGIGAFLCLLAGGTQYGPPLSKWFLPLAFLFAMGFMLASNMKDYKDFKGDYECNIKTFYVYMFNNGWAIGKTNMLVSFVLSLTLIMASLALSMIGAAIGSIAVGCVLGLIPGIVMVKLPPRPAVNCGLIAIMVYFIFLIGIIPKLPF